MSLFQRLRAFLAKRRLKRANNRVISDQEAGRRGLTRTQRVCDVFDLFEFSAAQRASVVISSLSEDDYRLVWDRMPRSAVHAVAREALIRREVTEELRGAILSDFLGLELAQNVEVEHLLVCLASLVEREIGVVTADLLTLFLGEPEAAGVDDYDTQYFFRDLKDAHKVALVLWLTGHQDERVLEDVLEERGRLFIRQGRAVLRQLNQRTKLRVLRECLDLPLSDPPKPSDEEEFGRLALALNTVHRDDPSKFFAGIIERWPHTVVNPLILKMFERKSG